METEKQYAIEQFLAVPAPKESRVRSLSELIERTFAAARVRLEDVKWKATRRGLEPWKISAQFESSGRTVCAEWSWNMHDNAVVCLNSAARKLIGEQDTSKEGHAEKHVDQGFLTSLNLPGDSARSARIEQTVSAWNTLEPPTTAPAPSDDGRTAANALDAPNPITNNDAPLPDRPEAVSSLLPTEEKAPQAATDTQDAKTGVVEATAPATPKTEQTQDPHSQNTTKTKRRSGRSAVPSWDEILFGD